MYAKETEDFAKLEQHEQSKILYEMLRYLRGQTAVIQKEQIDFRLELSKRANAREAVEANTKDKIEAILNKRFDFWVYFRDRVLPGIIQLIVIALLYLAFQQP